MKRFKTAFMSVLTCALGLFMAAELKGDPIEWTGGNGDWSEPSNWSGSEVPGESDEVVIGKKVTVNLSASVKIASLTLSNQALLHVTAQPLNDVTVFNPASYATEQARRAAVAAALWANRTVVEVTGAFVVDAGCTVQPENDKITGTPVVFKVGSASIAGTINATGMGWGWEVLSEDSAERPDNVPAGALAQHGGDQAIKNVWLYTYAFGSGSAEAGGFGFSPLYGGTTAADTMSVYGYPCAPFLPGSPSQYYNVGREMRGGGSIIIYAATSVSVTGTLETKGYRGGTTGWQAVGCTGGGVWIAAQDITLADSATISANGEESNSAGGAYGKGGGGRIALTRVASEEELATLASGVIPPLMVVSDYVNPNVTATSPKPENNGTVKWAVSGYLQATLTTRSNVDGLLAAGVTWGDEVLMNGNYERTAPQYAYLAEDATIRYTCQGYVISNKNGEVSSSDVELTARFTINGSEGPYSLTWKWGDRREVDPDPVSRHWVGGASGSLMDLNNWDPAGVPTRVDELYITNAAVSATKVKVAKLVLSGGSLTVGSSATRESFEFSVSGDVTVCDGAVLNVYAPRKTNPAGYLDLGDKAASLAAARLLLWQNRTKVVVGGTFIVDDGSTVLVSNHPETGDLVVFEVGSFDLEAGGTVTAEGMGFTWLPTEGQTLPEGTILQKGTAKINNLNCECYTYGFGTVNDYRVGAVHGFGYSAWNIPSYGFDFAPFEPGSCGYATGNNNTVAPGGGSIVVFAKGAVMLAGTLNADGVPNGSLGGASGGSIWVAGDTIAYGDGLIATARGTAYNYWAYGAGDGGRIAFMTDVTTAEQVETLVGGTKLGGFSYTALTHAGVSVDGGRRTPADEQPAGSPGTAVNAFSLASYELVTVTGSPFEAVSAKANYGEFQFRGGETVEREADAIGGDPVDPQNVRYVCTGYVVSNATEQVAEGKTTTLSFPVVKGEGPYKVVWLWNVRETRTRLVVSGPGTATVNGQTVSELWIADTENAVFAATPQDGKAFWAWSGVDVPAASVAETSFTIAADKPHVVSAVFADPSAAAKTCTLKTTASGDFYNPANWEDDLVPNPQDAVVVSGGACTVLGRFALGSLTMTGGSLSIAQVEDVAIAGDVSLSGGSVWTVTSVPTNGAVTAYSDGATHVAIGGNLVLADTATVKPVSDPWTGGSVVFTVAGDFMLDTSAKFDAVSAGWSWIEYTGERSPLALATVKTQDTKKDYQTMALGHGVGYTVGGSYGGRGSGYNGAVPMDTYGFANAPFYPGSPTGWYNSVNMNPGGGLIRIHIGGKATVNGTLDASGYSNYYGGSSGGGIWLTAAKFAFGETAQLLAHGGASAYCAQGAGGRIAIGTGLTAGQMASLRTTGMCVRKVSGLEEFQAAYPSVTVDLAPGVDVGSWGALGEPGTFSYYPAPKGLAIFLR